jgi:hypothetical protein
MRIRRPFYLAVGFDRHHLIFLTKSTLVKHALKLEPTPQVIYSWSVNADHVGRRWERERRCRPVGWREFAPRGEGCVQGAITVVSGALQCPRTKMFRWYVTFGQCSDQRCGTRRLIPRCWTAPPGMRSLLVALIREYRR